MMIMALCQIADCRAEVLVLPYRATEWSAFDWTTCWGILTAILVLVLVWFEWKLVQSGLRWWNQDNPAEAEVESSKVAEMRILYVRVQCVLSTIIYPQTLRMPS